MASNITPAIILPNELSGLDNLAYKIKFFMIHPGHPDGYRGDVLDKKYIAGISKIIIAETGTTNAFYIKDLGFSNAVSYRMQIMPMGITGQLNLIEPYGMSLYEKLVTAAYKLNIANHLAAKYIIQINFQGYKPDGEQTVVEYEWFVPTLLKKMTSTITEQGSDYTIQFVGLNYKASTNVSNSSKEPFAIRARTYGEFLDQYVIALNKHQEDLVKENSQMKADKFIIKFDEGYGPGKKALGSWRKPKPDAVRKLGLGANEPTTNKTTRRRDSWQTERVADHHEGLGIIKLTASKGTSIDSFITGVFMQTPYMKEITKSGAVLEDTGTGTSAQIKKRVKEEKKKLLKLDDLGQMDGWYNLENKWFMTISTDIKEGDWDPIRNQYQKTYTKVLQQYRVYHAIRDGYEYDKVKRDVKKITLDKMKALTEHGLLRKAYYWLYTGLNTEVLNFNFAFDNLYYVSTDLYFNSSLGERAAIAGSGKSDAEDTHKTTKNVNQRKDVAYKMTPMEQKEAFMKKGVFNSLAKKQDIFEGDVAEYLEDMSELSDSQSANSGKPFSNPSFVPDVIPKDLIYGTGAGGAPGVKDPGRIIYNINSGDMMELQLQIRGDPFWLGHTGPGSKNIPEDKFAPYSKGANYLYIEFKVPHGGVDPDSGQMPMSLANTISGIYFITNVQSNFSGGQFTQSLTGYLDVHFGLTQVRQAVGKSDDRIR